MREVLAIRQRFNWRELLLHSLVQLDERWVVRDLTHDALVEHGAVVELLEGDRARRAHELNKFGELGLDCLQIVEHRL